MQEPYMQQIANGEKTFEFRKYLIPASVQRIWFYRTAPHSSISHVCEISPARTRSPGDAPLPDHGLGNREYNTRHRDWGGYDYAYEILSVYRLAHPLTLARLRAEHGMKSAPRGLVYTPASITESLDWRREEKLWGDASVAPQIPANTTIPILR